MGTEPNNLKPWMRLLLILVSILAALLIVRMVDRGMEGGGDGGFPLASFEKYAVLLIFGAWAVDHVMRVAHRILHPNSQTDHKLTWKDVVTLLLTLGGSGLIYIGYACLLQITHNPA